MRILTFNWHEAYLCLLAKTGHQWDIVERSKGGSSIWFYETRPVPPNARIVSEATARDALRRGTYDAVVCHNLRDAKLIADYEVGAVLVFHNKLTTELALGGNQTDRASVLAECQNVLRAGVGFVLVFISEGKRQDWGLDGAVVKPGIDLTDYGGYQGREARALRIGNFMQARDLMLGYSLQRAILGERPSTLLGLNDPEPGARFTRGWDDLRGCLRSHRLLLNTTVEPFEDGYNLATLEAMATGMPIVSTANSTSPIRDGLNGFISADVDVLSGRVDQLLADLPLAERLGREARATVEREFPLSHFVDSWNDALATAAQAGRRRRRSVPQPTEAAEAVRGEPRSTARRRILLAYVSYPATTARYLEASFRRRHDVLTVGPAIDDRLVQAWNLQNLKERARPHDLPCGNDVDVAAVVERLADRWQPELFLWVESVPGFRPRNIPRLGCPTACYLIDTHLNLPVHLDWAARFDWVFVAQREYLPLFRGGGCSHVCWLPLACDPSVHGPRGVAKRHDIGFVGSLTADNPRRASLIARLRERFDVHVERSFLHEMAATLAASRVVFNNAIRNDLNMRVFETMCAGAFLLTDRAPGSGLQEMFLDRQHLAYYDDADIEAIAAHYLEHPDEREAIAERGREEVLRWHTYDHRAEALMARVLGDPADFGIDVTELARVADPVLRASLDLKAAGRGEEADVVRRLAREHRELSAVDAWYAKEGILPGRLGTAMMTLVAQ